jgi:hypothetical protein
MKKIKEQIEVIATFTEGWQERFTKAAYELWKECKENENKLKSAS